MTPIITTYEGWMAVDTMNEKFFFYLMKDVPCVNYQAIAAMQCIRWIKGALDDPRIRNHPSIAPLLFLAPGGKFECKWQLYDCDAYATITFTRPGEEVSLWLELYSSPALSFAGLMPCESFCSLVEEACRRVNPTLSSLEQHIVSECNWML